MADNFTWAGMIALNLGVTVFCDACERQIDLDLTKLPPDGKAIGVRFRCDNCGRYGSHVVYHKSVARTVPNQRPEKPNK